MEGRSPHEALLREAGTPYTRRLLASLPSPGVEHSRHIPGDVTSIISPRHRACQTSKKSCGTAKRRRVHGGTPPTTPSARPGTRSAAATIPSKRQGGRPTGERRSGPATRDRRPRPVFPGAQRLSAGEPAGIAPSMVCSARVWRAKKLGMVGEGERCGKSTSARRFDGHLQRRRGRGHRFGASEMQALCPTRATARRSQRPPVSSIRDPGAR